MAGRLNTLATLGETPLPEDSGFSPPPLYLQQFAPPQLPPGFLDVQTYRQNVPRVSGGVTLPFLGNGLELRGSYQRDPYLPDYSLMLGMRRQF